MRDVPGRSLRLFRLIVRLVGGLVLIGAAGCDSSNNSNADAGPAGPVTGTLDVHCNGVTPIVIDPNSCNVTPPADGGVVEEPLPVGFNAEADDDDCKYHVKFAATPTAKQNQNMTFKVTVTYLADGSPATGGVNAQGDGVAIESYLADNESHVVPNTTPPTMATETPAGSGVYTITPVRFDAAGRWVVRFHLFETCTDAVEASPHGHVGFYFDVP